MTEVRATCPWHMTGCDLRCSNLTEASRVHPRLLRLCIPCDWASGLWRRTIQNPDSGTPYESCLMYLEYNPS